MLKKPKRIIMCEIKIFYLIKHYLEVLTVYQKNVSILLSSSSEHGGADVVQRIAGAESTFRLA